MNPTTKKGATLSRDSFSGSYINILGKNNSLF